MHHELANTLARLALDAPDSSQAPRVGILGGEQARNVLLGLGYPPEEVDAVDLPYGFDGIEAIALKRRRRLAGLPVQGCLDVVIDSGIDRQRDTRKRKRKI